MHKRNPSYSETSHMFKGIDFDLIVEDNNNNKFIERGEGVHFME